MNDTLGCLTRGAEPFNLTPVNSQSPSGNLVEAIGKKFATLGEIIGEECYDGDGNLATTPQESLGQEGFDAAWQDLYGLMRQGFKQSLGVRQWESIREAALDYNYGPRTCELAIAKTLDLMERVINGAASVEAAAGVYFPDIDVASEPNAVEIGRGIGEDSTESTVELEKRAFASFCEVLNSDNLSMQQVDGLRSSLEKFTNEEARKAVAILLNIRSADNYEVVDALIVALCASKDRMHLVGGFYNKLREAHKAGTLGPVSKALGEAVNFKGKICFEFLATAGTAVETGPETATAPIDALDLGEIPESEALTNFLRLLDDTKLKNFNRQSVGELSRLVEQMETPAERQQAFAALARKRQGKVGARFIDEVIRELYEVGDEALRQLIYDQLQFMYDPGLQRTTRGGLRGGKTCLADLCIDGAYPFDFLAKHRTLKFTAEAEPATAPEAAAALGGKNVEDVLAQVRAAKRTLEAGKKRRRG